MYLIFFILLSGLGYGSLIFGRRQPLFLIIGIIAMSVLLVIMTESGNNTEGEVVIGINYDSTFAGVEQDAPTSMTKTGSDEYVLLKLQGVEYTVWVWLHVLLIITSMVFLFAYIMREGIW